MSLGVAEFERNTKRIRKREFLDEMNLIAPWAELVAFIAPHTPKPGAKGGCLAGSGGGRSIASDPETRKAR